MTKRVNGELYSDLITSVDPRAMACGGIPRRKIDTIVIHHNGTTNKSVAINTWLANGLAQTSCHYEVANGETIGIVGEETTAWHAGNADVNARSIGIENLNATGAPSWLVSEKTFDNLARLVADICTRYGFAPDETHVIPHSQVHATQCPGGINMTALRKRAMSYYKGKKPAPIKPNPKPTSKIKVGDVVVPHWGAGQAGKVWQFDDIQKIAGIWQGAEYLESGGRSAFTWVENGVPLDIVTLTDKKGKRLPNQTAITKTPYYVYKDTLVVAQVGHNPSVGDMAFIYPKRLGKINGFWVLTKYL